jgi:hypothetical protein
MLHNDDGSRLSWWQYAFIPIQLGCTAIVIGIGVLTTVGLAYLGWMVLFG